MSELSPQAEANAMELATTKGRSHVAARGPVGTPAPTDGVNHVGRGLAPADPSFRGPEGAVRIRLVRGIRIAASGLRPSSQ